MPLTAQTLDVSNTSTLSFRQMANNINKIVYDIAPLGGANLPALANLTGAANKSIYFTGVGTVSTYDLTAAGRALLDDADASAQLTTLGFSTFFKTLVDDADASAILSTLGFSAFIKTLIDDSNANTALGTLGVSAFARTLLDDANQTAARATLGVDASGTNQPIDDTLTALAGLNSTSGMVVQTGVDTFTKRSIAGTANEINVDNGNGVGGNPTLSLPTALTFTGKTITGGTFQTLNTDIAIADGGTGASTAQGGFDNLKQDATTSYKGVVELATDAETRTGTDSIRGITPSNLTAKEATEAEYIGNTADRILTTDIVWVSAAEKTLTDGTTISVNLANTINATVTLGGNRTLGSPSGEKVGQSGVIRIVQDATGSRTLAYGSDWKFAGGNAPTLSTAANAVDLLFYHVYASNYIVGNLVKDVK